MKTFAHCFFKFLRSQLGKDRTLARGSFRPLADLPNCDFIKINFEENSQKLKL
jgi:hypothetical protein